MRVIIKESQQIKTKEKWKYICAINIAERIYFVYTKSKYLGLFRTNNRKEPGWEKKIEK